VVGLSLALGLFSWTFICVNGSGDSASRRLEGVGRWVFRSYHAGSAYILNVSAKMIPDLNEQIARREQTIQKLLPYASATDFEINFLYHKLGVAQYAGRQFKNARISFTEALRRDPENASAIRMLGLIAMQTRNFEEASKIFSFYNKRINSPRIVDPRIPAFEYSCNQLKKLVSSGVDSTTIEHELDVIFQETK
jgi:tetratricopeptide (TPR) repeat protein